MLLGLVHLSLVLGMQVSGIQAFGGEEYLPSQEDLAHAIQQAKKVREEANKLISKDNLLDGRKLQRDCPTQMTVGKNIQGNEQINGCLRNKTPPSHQNDLQHDPSTPINEKKNQILVFVSFSMPEASLKSLAQEAQRVSLQGDAFQRKPTQQHHVVLIMRGLYQDSFVRTASKFQELGISVDIHPELFETHHVTSVPTFLQLENGEAIHSLKGNVTLDFVMKTFEDQRVKEAS